MSAREAEHLRRQVGALRQRLADTREILKDIVERLEKLEAEKETSPT